MYSSYPVRRKTIGDDVVLSRLVRRIQAFNPDQPRDSDGKWGSGGSVSNALEEINSKFPQNPDNPKERVLMVSGKPAATFELAERDGRLRLKTIKSTETKSGVGSLILGRLTKIADKHAVTIELTSAPYGDDKDRISHEKLQSWYESHGFKPEAGYDSALGYMIREPKK